MLKYTFFMIAYIVSLVECCELFFLERCSVAMSWTIQVFFCTKILSWLTVTPLLHRSSVMKNYGVQNQSISRRYNFHVLAGSVAPFVRRSDGAKERSWMASFRDRGCLVS